MAPKIAKPKAKTPAAAAEKPKDAKPKPAKPAAAAVAKEEKPVAPVKKDKSSVQKKKVTALQRKIRLMKQKYSMYPEKKSKKKGAHPKVTLRSRLTPGTVVILVAGRQQYKGVRMVFVKLLESGHLLLAGPTSLNGRPLMPVLQNFVIATSTKVPLNKQTTEAAKKITFSMFKKERKQKPKESGIFSDTTAVESTGPRIDPQVEKALDAGLMKSVTAFSKDKLEKDIFKCYMRRKFTVKNGQFPHNMKF